MTWMIVTAAAGLFVAAGGLLCGVLTVEVPYPDPTPAQAAAERSNVAVSSWMMLGGSVMLLAGLSGSGLRRSQRSTIRDGISADSEADHRPFHACGSAVDRPILDGCPALECRAAQTRHATRMPEEPVTLPRVDYLIIGSTLPRSTARSHAAKRFHPR
jgi:hypothetical protein